jgi:hypothetical protein
MAQAQTPDGGAQDLPDCIAEAAVSMEVSTDSEMPKQRQQISFLAVQSAMTPPICADADGPVSSSANRASRRPERSSSKRFAKWPAGKNR